MTEGPELRWRRDGKAGGGVGCDRDPVLPAGVSVVMKGPVVASVVMEGPVVAPRVEREIKGRRRGEQRRQFGQHTDLTLRQEHQARAVGQVWGHSSRLVASIPPEGFTELLSKSTWRKTQLRSPRAANNCLNWAMFWLFGAWGSMMMLRCPPQGKPNFSTSSGVTPY